MIGFMAVVELKMVSTGSRVAFVRDGVEVQPEEIMVEIYNDLKVLRQAMVGK